MINFEEELSRFHPALEVKDSADSIKHQEFTDLTDIMLRMSARGQAFPAEMMQAAAGQAVTQFQGMQQGGTNFGMPGTRSLS